MKTNDMNYIKFTELFFTIIFCFTIIMTYRVNTSLNKNIKNYDNNIQITTSYEKETNEKIEDNKEINDNKKDNTDNIAVMANLDINSNITVPVHGEITSYFGGRTNPITGLYAEHSGIDIASKQGTDILAAYNGIVEETGTAEKAGNYILLLHSDGSETLYCHCSEICSEEGNLIKAGDVIAKIGSTGWSTGPHLHFEVRIDGESVDPLEYLVENDGCV